MKPLLPPVILTSAPVKSNRTPPSYLPSKNDLIQAVGDDAVDTV